MNLSDDEQNQIQTKEEHRHSKDDKKKKDKKDKKHKKDKKKHRDVEDSPSIGNLQEMSEAQIAAELKALEKLKEPEQIDSKQDNNPKPIGKSFNLKLLTFFRNSCATIGCEQLGSKTNAINARPDHQEL